MIKGRLIIIGEMVVEGEDLTGAFIECSKEELKKNRGLFFEDVTISAAQPAVEEDAEKPQCSCGEGLTPDGYCPVCDGA